MVVQRASQLLRQYYPALWGDANSDVMDQVDTSSLVLVNIRPSETTSSRKNAETSIDVWTGTLKSNAVHVLCGRNGSQIILQTDVNGRPFTVNGSKVTSVISTESGQLVVYNNDDDLDLRIYSDAICLSSTDDAFTGDIIQKEGGLGGMSPLCTTYSDPKQQCITAIENVLQDIKDNIPCLNDSNPSAACRTSLQNALSKLKSL